MHDYKAIAFRYLDSLLRDYNITKEISFRLKYYDNLRSVMIAYKLIDFMTDDEIKKYDFDFTCEGIKE